LGWPGGGTSSGYSTFPRALRRYAFGPELMEVAGRQVGYHGVC